MSYTELEHGYQGLRNAGGRPTQFYVGGTGDLELCDPSDASSLSPQEMDDGGKVVIVGVCAMAKKSESKPMKEILTRLQEFEYIKIAVFPEDIILQKPVEEWPVCDCLISFHSKGFPLDKAIQYAQLHNPYVINNLHMQYDIQDRRKVYSTLEAEGIEIPRYAVLDRDSSDPKQSEDHVEVNGVVFNKPFVEKPVSAEDHNIYIYYPTSAGGGSQRLFRKIGSRSSVYSPESRVRKTGSFIYEDFMPTDGTDVKVYTVGPDYAHAEARKSPALDGKVERDREGKEIRYPVILSNAEKLISRKVCLAFKQAVCGFDLLRANGKSFVCDVNGFSFVKNSNKYYDDCAKILGNMILRELAPTLHIPWSVPFQLDDPPIVPTTFGKMMELRCVVAVIRHGDRTPKQKMKVEVRHPKFFEIFEKYDGYKHGHVKLKRPKQLQEILDTARSLLAEIQQHEADPEIEEKQGKLEQLKGVLEMYGHFSGINRKVQMKYQPKGRPRGSSSDDVDKPAEPSLVLILKWGGELTPAGRIQAEELGRIFRCMYPGGQGRHLAGEYAGAQGLGLLRLHSTFRHDLKIYASDEGRVQMTAAAFAKGLLALEGELTPILVQMVKSANTNGLLDNDCDSSKHQNMCKARLHELMQLDRDFSQTDREKINPCTSSSITDALDFVKNPVKCCRHVHELIKSLMEIVQIKKEDLKTKDAILYHGETWELMGRRWGKIEKDFYTKSKTFDISKIPDIYDCIKYDLQHNQHTLQFEQAEELYMYAKYLADIVIPQEYGLTAQEKLTIGQGICTPLLKKIRADLQRNIEESGEETVNRLNPRYSHGVSSPGRHVRTRLYFTSESHIHSLITVLRHGGLLNIKTDEQWRRAMEYVSMVSELNYMSQVVIMLYEDPTKDPCSEERFHVELHFSPGVNCCVQKNLPPGPGFRPHSRNESTANKNSSNTSANTETQDDTTAQSQVKCSTSGKIDEENEVTVTVVEEEQPLSIESSSEPLPSSSPARSSDLPTIISGEEITYRHYLKSSDPIPIGSSHTVSGHEAMHLAKCLNEELAAQQHQSNNNNKQRNRALSPDPEPRAKSYDHKSSPQKGSGGRECSGNSTVVSSSSVKRHRHGVAGQMSYYKMLGFGCGGPLGFKKLQAGTTSNSLFSTAVISGSSSAPNLCDMISSTASASAIEGFGGVPPIRPLETLHNALSLRQIDTFLDHMTAAPLFRTPSSTPPKYPSTPPPSSASANGGAVTQADLPLAAAIAPPQPLKLQSPSSNNSSMGWSGPPSFVSGSSGPSSPGMSETTTNSKESSEMSSSIISGDGSMLMDNYTKIFPTAPGLDRDLGNVPILLDLDRETSGSMEFSDYYTHLQRSMQGDSGGEVTPVSGGSEIEFNTNDATAGSTADYDVTVTEDIESSFTLGDEDFVDGCVDTGGGAPPTTTDNNLLILSNNSTITPKIISPSHSSSHVNILNVNNTLHTSSSDTCCNMLTTKKHVENFERLQPASSSRIYNDFDLSNSQKDFKNISKQLNAYDKELTGSNKNISILGSDKWCTSKEKFLENNTKSFRKTDDGGGSGGGVTSIDSTETDLSSSITKLNTRTVLVKEHYIEPPRITRVSRSFHGTKSDTGGGYLDISVTPRRASEGVSPPNCCDVGMNAYQELMVAATSSRHRNNVMDKFKTNNSSSRPQFISQLSQPCGGSLKSPNLSCRKGSLNDSGSVRQPQLSTHHITKRFTTTLVNEAEHAASVRLSLVNETPSQVVDCEGNAHAAEVSQQLVTVDDLSMSCPFIKPNNNNNNDKGNN